MSYPHAIVWLDHQHATVIDYSVDDVHVQRVETETPRKLHRKSGPMGTGKAPDDHVFYDAVVDALGNAREILIVGPGNAKTSFHKDLQKRHAPVAKRVLGVEASDHPNDAELLAYAKKYFKKIDSLLGNP